MLKCVKFTELPVVDQDRAVRFCTEKVGLRVAQDSSYTAGWRWIELEIPGAQTRLLLTRRSEEAEQGRPRLVLVAEDPEATFRELESRGVQFTRSPASAPWDPQEVYATFVDSEGNGVVIGSR